MSKPSVGRIVHYVLPNKEHRAAVVVMVPPDTLKEQVNLSVFTDWVGDASHFDSRGLVYQPFVEHDEGGAPRSWHWPEKEGA